MRSHELPLFSVDTHRAASDFDILAFNLSSELVFTNVLEMIDLAGIPLHAADRRPEDALVIVGGHAAFNPEPLADFIDAAALGEGEEVVSEITVLVREWKASGRTSREGFLRELSKIPGVYVPSMYEVTYDGPRLVAITPRFGDGEITCDAGKTSRRNIGERPHVSLVWPPVVASDYSLIVDGTATVDNETVRITPTRAVRHRPAPGGGNDCAPVNL